MKKSKMNFTEDIMMSSIDNYILYLKDLKENSERVKLLYEIEDKGALVKILIKNSDDSYQATCINNAIINITSEQNDLKIGEIYSIKGSSSDDGKSIIVGEAKKEDKTEKFEVERLKRKYPQLKDQNALDQLLNNIQFGMKTKSNNSFSPICSVNIAREVASAKLDYYPSELKQLVKSLIEATNLSEFKRSQLIHLANMNFYEKPIHFNEEEFEKEWEKNVELYNQNGAKNAFIHIGKKMMSTGSSLSIVLLGQSEKAKNAAIDVFCRHIHFRYFPVDLSNLSSVELLGSSSSYKDASAGKLLQINAMQEENNQHALVFSGVDHIMNDNQYGSVKQLLLNLVENQSYEDPFLDSALISTKGTTNFILLTKIERFPSLKEKCELIQFETPNQSTKIEAVKSFIFPKVCSQFDVDQKICSEDVLRYLVEESCFNFNYGECKTKLEDLILTYRDKPSITKADVQKFLEKQYIDQDLKTFANNRDYFTDSQHSRALELLNEKNAFVLTDKNQNEYRNLCRDLNVLLNFISKKEENQKIDQNKILSKLNEVYFGQNELKELLISNMLLKQQKPLLLFSSVPGTGKTSIAKIYGQVLGKHVLRMEANNKRLSDLTGMLKPGLIASEYTKNNESFILLVDEIDKASPDVQDYFLNMLDSNTIHDEYLHCDFDTSSILVILTANDLTKISWPILDRCCVFEMKPYSFKEKLSITEHKLEELSSENNVPLPEKKEILKLVKKHSKEIGIRPMIEDINRLVSKKLSSPEIQYSSILEEKTDSKLLLFEELREKTNLPASTLIDGIMLGFSSLQDFDDFNPDTYSTRTGSKIGEMCTLHVSGNQGGFTKIQTVKSTADKLSANTSKDRALEDSWSICLDCVRTLLNKKSELFLHTQIGELYVDKAGTSGMLATALSMYSCITQQSIPSSLACTGELDLLGNTFAIGGIEQKMYGAIKNGFNTVILPSANQKDVEKTILKYDDRIQIIYVSSLKDAIKYVFGTVVE